MLIIPHNGVPIFHQKRWFERLKINELIPENRPQHLHEQMHLYGGMQAIRRRKPEGTIKRNYNCIIVININLVSEFLSLYLVIYIINRNPYSLKTIISSSSAIYIQIENNSTNYRMKHHKKT